MDGGWGGGTQRPRGPSGLLSVMTPVMRAGSEPHTLPGVLTFASLSIKLCKSALLRIFILMRSCNLGEEFSLSYQCKIDIFSKHKHKLGYQSLK